jgi:formate dehydrogenase (NADP+) alpha subunit
VPGGGRENSGRLLAACVTPAAQGCVPCSPIRPQVLRHRRNIVRLMMAEHPESCIVCDKGNRCRLRGIAAELGIGDNGLVPHAQLQAPGAGQPLYLPGT